MTFENPAWDLIKDIPGDDLDLKYDRVWRPNSYQDQDGPTRNDITAKYAWAIPAPESIDWIVERLDGRAVVEIGAGTGYWAWQLSQRGVDVNAYDLHPPSEGFNHYHSPRVDRLSGYTDEERQEHYDRWKKWDDMAAEVNTLNESLPEDRRAVPMPRHKYVPLPDQDVRSLLDGVPGASYHPVIQGGTGAVAYPENEGRALFLCWPPYDRDMAVETLRAYPGDMLIYIGEGEGGCTGNDDFWQLLAKEWEWGAGGPLHQWWGLHDHLETYRRVT